MVLHNQIKPLLPLVKADVYSLEVKIGKDLPEEYKDFLLSYNGGVPQKRYLTCEELDNEYKIEHLLSTDEIKQYYTNIEQYLSPDQLFPISDTIGSTIVCLSLGEDNYGYVYVYDWDLGIGHVGDSFIDFINSLKERSLYD